jgi:hypothetical protein
MRSPRLTVIVTAAAATLALAPAGASAAHKPGHLRALPLDRCRLTMVAEPRFLTSGETAQLAGQLLCTHGAVTSGQPVTVYQRTAGGPGFQVLGTATTAAGGFYSMLAPSLTAETSFYATSATARSGRRTVHVAPQVTLKGPAENVQLLTGARTGVTFAGTVAPADAGAEILLQRESATSSEDWFVIKRGIVGAGGVYSLTHKFLVPGDANLRVVVRPDHKFFVRGISNTLSYSISQRQNPRLTINSSTDPIAYGQSTGFTGTLAGGANQPVTLLARGFGGAYAPVAKATTDAGGNYSFTQSPLQSTFYRVAASSTKSAVLFEGVKSVLTAAVSTSTVESGQALTFSGKVTPARAGHVVYVERQNTVGGGYHVVDVTTVATDGSYSIAHAIFGKGSEVFRVKIPGDHVNQATSSSPFTIEVTPATAGAAPRRHAPAKLPGEGRI